jgi:hypothetical protein
MTLIIASMAIITEKEQGSGILKNACPTGGLRPSGSQDPFVTKKNAMPFVTGGILNLPNGGLAKERRKTAARYHNCTAFHLI